MNTTTILRKKGQLVIPRKLKTMELLEESSALAKAKGVTLEEMLADLDEIRHNA